MSENKEYDFRDLEVWLEAHRLTIVIYKLSIGFPKTEIYGLTSQIRRAAVSVELNIAEGSGRHHLAEDINFLYNSRGSVSEVQSCLIIAKDLNFIDSDKVSKLFSDYRILSKRINSLVNYKRKKNAK